VLGGVGLETASKLFSTADVFDNFRFD